MSIDYRLGLKHCILATLLLLFMFIALPGRAAVRGHDGVILKSISDFAPLPVQVVVLTLLFVLLLLLISRAAVVFWRGIVQRLAPKIADISLYDAYFTLVFMMIVFRWL